MGSFSNYISESCHLEIFTLICVLRFDFVSFGLTFEPWPRVSIFLKPTRKKTPVNQLRLLTIHLFWGGGGGGGCCLQPPTHHPLVLVSNAGARPRLCGLLHRPQRQASWGGRPPAV